VARPTAGAALRPTLKGLFGDVNGVGAGADGAGADGAGADGVGVGWANENGELGELKIEGTAGCGGDCGGCGEAAGGLVKGSGYSGIALAAAENGFGEGT
jgi:hypothetical protein